MIAVIWAFSAAAERYDVWKAARAKRALAATSPAP